MSKNISQNHLRFIGAILVVGAVSGGSYLFSQEYTLQPVAQSSASGGTKQEYSTHLDLGQISMKEGVQQFSYRFKNTAAEPLTLNQLYTSCMCTKAKLILDGVETVFAGMEGHTGGLTPIDPNMTLQPNQEAELLVEFDPNAHGPQGVGPLTRSVIVETTNPQQPQLQFTFAGVVVQ